ncbi:hypothetical protein J4Q44_G00196690 [Coregonus suidteri]|uniref:Cyclic nucleotide-binding domain-containing protein n=1 Tax=Coregonus suidteri TaxID=861788 RepID=A0AAN8LFQ4_9TELE
MHTVLVANAAAMMTNIDASAKAYKDKVNHLKDYMSYRKLPKALGFTSLTTTRPAMEGNGLTRRTRNLVSKSLKEEILTVICAALMNNTPMFQNRDVNFLNAVLTQLQFEVFQEADIITSGDRMFFIEHGQFLVKTDFFQKELIDGDYFGEICLLTKGSVWPRCEL